MLDYNLAIGSYLQDEQGRRCNSFTAPVTVNMDKKFKSTAKNTSWEGNLAKEVKSGDLPIVIDQKPLRVGF